MSLTSMRKMALLKRLDTMEFEERERLNRTKAQAADSIEVSYDSELGGASTKSKPVDDPSVFENDRSCANLFFIGLARIRLLAGVYTQCIGCGGEIEKKRQQKSPLALLCLDCLTKLEESVEYRLVGMKLVQAIKTLLAA